MWFITYCACVLSLGAAVCCCRISLFMRGLLIVVYCCLLWCVVMVVRCVATFPLSDVGVLVGCFMFAGYCGLFVGRGLRVVGCCLMVVVWCLVLCCLSCVCLLLSLWLFVVISSSLVMLYGLTLDVAGWCVLLFDCCVWFGLCVVCCV